MHATLDQHMTSEARQAATRLWVAACRQARGSSWDATLARMQRIRYLGRYGASLRAGVALFVAGLRGARTDAELAQVCNLMAKCCRCLAGPLSALGLGRGWLALSARLYALALRLHEHPTLWTGLAWLLSDAAESLAGRQRAALLHRARACLDNADRLDPVGARSPAARHARGRLARLRGCASGASIESERELAAAARFSPGARVHCDRGAWFAALECDPLHAPTHLGLALELRDVRGDLAGAVQWFAKTVALLQAHASEPTPADHAAVSALALAMRSCCVDLQAKASAPRPLVSASGSSHKGDVHIAPALLRAARQLRTRHTGRRAPAVFLSYAWPDSADPETLRDARRVEALALCLDAAGCRVFFDKWATAAGDSIARFVEQIDFATIIVLCGSPLYLRKLQHAPGAAYGSRDPPDRYYYVRLEWIRVAALLHARDCAPDRARVVPAFLSARYVMWDTCFPRLVRDAHLVPAHIYTDDGRWRALCDILAISPDDCIVRGLFPVA